ncbi:MAG: methyl-accepting chemotaxis protein [Phycisphaerales bacterium]
MRFGITAKLTVIGACGLVLAGGVGVYTYTQTRVLADIAHEVSTQGRAMTLCAEGDMMHDALRGDMLEWVGAVDDGGRRSAAGHCGEHAGRFREVLDEVARLEVTGEQSQALERSRKGVEAYIGSVEHLMALSPGDAEAVGAGKQLVTQEFNALEGELESLSGLFESGFESASGRTKAVNASVARTLEVSLGVGTVAVIALVAWVTRSITRRIGRMNSILATMRTGDLTGRVGDRGGDELGDIARSLDDTSDSLASLIREVTSAAHQIAAASTEIAASAEEMSAGLTKQEGESQQAAAAVEEMNATVQEVARQTGDAASAAKSSQQEAASGARVVHETVAEIKGIATDVGSSATAVTTLGDKSQQIGEIIKVINDIADQTNLLALNAAIEAARAGEHGRGFAVVADEVRKLAERTTKATEEVASSIKDIQVQTSSAVQLIESGSQRVAKGVDLAQNAGQALGRISQSSQGLAGMVQSIAAAAEQQAASSQQIAKAVETINAVTRESSQGASQVAQAATDLSQQSEKLQGMVQRFKL